MAAQNNAPLPDGLEIAGYRIVKKIASGGFSIVYLAYDSDGVAVAISESAAGTLTIEIKSVNSRFLDLQFRINDDLRALEPDLRSAIMGAITRGKVEMLNGYPRFNLYNAISSNFQTIW